MCYEPATGLDARQLLVDRKFNMQELCSLPSSVSDGHSVRNKLMHYFTATVNIRECGLKEGNIQTEL